MQSLTRSILRLGRRRSVVRAGSAPPRRWPPALAQQDSPFMAVASSRTVEHLDRISPTIVASFQPSLANRLWSMEKMGIKLMSSTSFTCATTIFKETIARKKAANEVARRNPTPVDYILVPPIFENSTHHDGAIYKNMFLREAFDDVDFTDRTETRLEPMMQSEATEVCRLYGDKCMAHFPEPMLQFCALTLADCHISNGSIELYGYIATRDERDMMLNYIFNRSRDDPIIVQQDSFIEMTGPKRAIGISCPVLVEYDMRIKNGEEGEADLQLIDGTFGCDDDSPWPPVKHRISGDCGTVDMSLVCVEHAVEATIEVVISEVRGGFTLSVSSFIDIMDVYEEIQLFDGTVDHFMGIRRFVVAVTWDTMMLLRLANDNVEHCCSFKAQHHGYAEQNIQLKLASVSVKVTWSTVSL